MRYKDDNLIFETGSEKSKAKKRHNIWERRKLSLHEGWYEQIGDGQEVGLRKKC